MKAVILVNPYLSSEAELYQPRRIAEELELLGVEARILPNAWAGEIGRDGLVESLSREYGFCVYLDKDRYMPRILEKRGMRLFNRAEAVELCDDKVLTHIALSGVVPMPETLFSPLCYKEHVPAVSADVAAERLGLSLVVKECFGSLGQQVFLARDRGELQTLSERLKLKPHLYQRFVEESAGRDVRAVCVGGEIVACMERRSETDFRSNLSLGGQGTPFEPTDEIRSLCRKACEALGLDYCGVDLLFGRDGMLVCEVNSNAFFGGIERATGLNIAKIYSEYMLKSLHGV